MKIDALRAVQTVAEHGSLTAAARVLGQSEPALSRLVSALEHEMRLTLFDRTGRQLRPSEAGRAFLAELQPVLAGLDRVSDVAAEIRAGARRRVRLVSMPRLTTAITAPVVARFKAAHPEVDLSVDVQPRRMLESWLTGQRFDLGLSTLPARHRDIDTEPLFDLPAVAVLPVGHRLAGADALGVEDLARDPFVALGPGTLLRAQVEAIYGRANALMRPAVEVSQTLLACHLVMAGAGVTICDPMIPSAYPDRLVCVPIAPRHGMAFGTHRLRGAPPSPEAEALAALAREVGTAFAARWAA